MDIKKLFELIDKSDNGIITCQSPVNWTYYYIICKGIDGKIHSFRCEEGCGDIYDFDDHYGLLDVALNMYSEKDFELDEPKERLYHNFCCGICLSDHINPDNISDYEWFEKYKALLPHLLGDYENPFYNPALDDY